MRAGTEPALSLSVHLRVTVRPVCLFARLIARDIDVLSSSPVLVAQVTSRRKLVFDGAGLSKVYGRSVPSRRDSRSTTATWVPGLLRGDIRCGESSSPFNLARSSRALRTVRGLVNTACFA